MRLNHVKTTSLVLAHCLAAVEGLRLWSKEPADPNNILMTTYVIGNGKQGAMPLGIPGNDTVSLNHDSLWSGGPFSNPNYTGGNPSSSLAHFLPGIQSSIFQNGTGDESALYGSTDDYGSYQNLGRLTVTLAGVANYTNYVRALDLETAVHSTSFTANGADYSTYQFCSYVDQVCIYHVNSTHLLPDVAFGVFDDSRTSPPSNTSCSKDGVHLSGRTQADDGVGDIGMKFDAQVQVAGCSKLKTRCSNDMTIISGGSSKSVTLVLATGTEYDASKGNAASKYSFRGDLPYTRVLETATQASKKSYSTMLKNHISDHKSLKDLFSLQLPDPLGSSKIDTTTLLKDYTWQKGDPFVENLIVDYGQYMFIASSRPGSLPPNLQGNWADSLNPAWSSDYHIDINVQMNNWHTEQMGLGTLMEPLSDFITQTIVPRGTETARLWYNASGYVAYSNVNIFGHTAQGNDATWSDLQHDVAWLLQYVWDRFDYSQDAKWYRSTGYPLLKPVAQFWLDMLVDDEYSKDGTLVANPCNSPEHGPTTFGCAQFQQVVWELFDHIIKGWSLSGDSDQKFLNRVKEAYEKMDKGVRVGSWGQIQEWKIDMDVKNDTHRHLSHLSGWYPGSAIAAPYWNNKTITNAIATTLYSRGNGTADSNTGWEKAWRSACWARLGVVDEAYMEYKYAIKANFAPNLMSVYTTSNSYPSTLALPFQIDANFGLAGAALAMLITDVAQWSGDGKVQQVILGPSIPAEWGSGSVKGLRLRRGGMVDFKWDNHGVVSGVVLHSRSNPVRIVDKSGKNLASV